ncbi:MAG TPA: homocysteine S-methyltransferase [Desulfobacteraceae bacterium]|nr:homocysteine S-methyltransferase [Desulfobacteraceae bacterium]
MTRIGNALSRQNILVVDGAMGTQLEQRGCDLNDPIWSARLLAESPETVAAVHTDYLKAGADCLITASYQATFEGFSARGVSETAAAGLIRSAVTLARDCVDTFWADPANRKDRMKPLVAASVGPYGAYLADGSEFRGDYNLSESELAAFHRKRLATLIQAGPDLLACETIPCFSEARALAALLEEFVPVEAWVSFSARDGRHISNGEPVRDCAAWLDDKPSVAAVGINCTDPQYIPSLIREIRWGTDKPVIVYPNRGGVWDAAAKTWLMDHGLPTFDEMAARWFDAGARLIGGCCQTGPADIRALAKALKQPKT